MNQLALAYDAATTGAVEWDAQIQWLRRAVDMIGHKEVAYKLDVQPSQLTDALLERERKDVKAKWFPTVLRMVSEEMRAEYLRIIADPLGYTLKRKRPRTAEERERDRTAWLRANAPALLSAMDKELGE